MPDCMVLLPAPDVPLVAEPDPLVADPVEPEPVDPEPVPPEVVAPVPLPMRAFVSMNCAPDLLVCVPLALDPVVPEPLLPEPVAEDPVLPLPLVPDVPPAMSALCRHPVTVTVWPCWVCELVPWEPGFTP